MCSSTTTTTPEPETVPAGVVWEAHLVDASPGVRPVAVVATDDLWLIAANVVALDPSEPAIPVMFTSTDGAVWSRTAIPAEPWSSVAAVAHGPAGFVAVGTVGTDCASRCVGGYGMVWVSADGRSWEPMTDPVFRGPNRVTLSAVAVAGERYVTIGRDERSGSHWAVGVWRSADGRSWERTATLEHPRWSLRDEALIEVEGGLMTAATATLCRNPNFLSSTGWTITNWLPESVAWTSPDGAAWDPLDLRSLGLVVGADDDVCDDDSGQGDAWWLVGVARAPSAGGGVGLGDAALWRRSDDAWFVMRGGAWEPYAPSPGGRPGGLEGFLRDAEGYLHVGLDGSAGVATLRVARSVDLASWEDWSDRVPPLVVDVLEPDHAPRFSTAAARGAEVLVAVTGHSAGPGSPSESRALVALISRPGPAPNG